MPIDQLLQPFLEPVEKVLNDIADLGEVMAAQKAAREAAKVEKATPYRVSCPGCGTTVVREELLDKGCYICGWRPADEDEV